MATALAQQLASIAQAAGGSTPKHLRKGKASLLHDFQTASDISVDAVHAAALQGACVLCVASPPMPRPQRLRYYAVLHHALRHITAACLDARPFLSIVARSTAQPMRRSTRSCTAAWPPLQTTFSTQPHSRSSSCSCVYTSACYSAHIDTHHHAMRCRVHLHNVDAMLTTALPFHETNEFVRVVQICDLSTTRLWQWLTPMQQSGAALPRATLVQRCVNDRALFDRICQAALHAGNPSQLSRSMVGLYAVVACQVLAGRPKVDEGSLQHLLPYLLAGLAPAAAPDLTCATAMVIAQLATTTTLGLDVLQGVCVLRGVVSGHARVACTKQSYATQWLYTVLLYCACCLFCYTVHVACFVIQCMLLVLLYCAFCLFIL